MKAYRNLSGTSFVIPADDTTAGFDDPTDATPELVWQSRRNAHGYEIYVNKVNDRANAVYRVISPATAKTSHIVCEPLEDNTEYEFWLRAVHEYDFDRNTRWGTNPVSSFIQVVGERI